MSSTNSIVTGSFTEKKDELDSPTEPYSLGYDMETLQHVVQTAWIQIDRKNMNEAILLEKQADFWKSFGIKPVLLGFYRYAGVSRTVGGLEEALFFMQQETNDVLESVTFRLVKFVEIRQTADS